MKGNSADCNVSIIGAGPYGLSAAAYLKAVNVEARIFGEPMTFWEKQMPAGMYLRSHPSSLAHCRPQARADARRVLSAKRQSCTEADSAG